MLKIAVFISGNGSNLQAIIDAIGEHDWPVEIACVISDRTSAYGLERAELANIPNFAIERQNFSNREQFERELIKTCSRYQTDWIVLAGFMRILSETFLNAYRNRIVNIHPSLLPKYPGLDTHAKVLANGDEYHGATVHLVTADLDAGPILAQQSFAVMPEDDLASLESKVHAIEHEIYPAVIKQIAEGQLNSVR